MLMWKADTTMKMLLCFKLTITMVIASIEEESKLQMPDGDTHDIACVQRGRLGETCNVGPWLKCPPDSNMDTIRASTTDASEDLILSKTVLPAPVTTPDSDPHATPSPADRRLLSTCRDGDLERVKRILAAGHVNINTRGGYYSRTPVMEAARRGHRDVVEFLVGRQADVSLVDRRGNNILHWACMGKGDLETVKLILSLNVVDINSREWLSRTPVMRAAEKGHSDVVEFLVGRGADASLVDMSGNNILHWACEGGHLDTVKLILSLDVVDINARNNYEKTAAFKARVNRRQRVLDLLLSRGAH